MDGSIMDSNQNSGTSQESCMPLNFSWVIDNQLCGLGFPDSNPALQYLVDRGVTGLVSLTAERVPDISMFPGLTLYCVKLADFTAPTLEQIQQCMDIIDKHLQVKEAVAVHCAHGKGRTGTILACYIGRKLGLSGSEAIRMVRDLRQGSIETVEQEMCVHEYVDGQSRDRK